MIKFSVNSWTRFSLRGLFILVTVCCLLLGAWSVYVNPFRQQARSVAALEPLQAEVTTSSVDGPGWQRWLVTTMLGDAVLQGLAGL